MWLQALGVILGGYLLGRPECLPGRQVLRASTCARSAAHGERLDGVGARGALGGFRWDFRCAQGGFACLAVQNGWG